MLRLSLANLSKICPNSHLRWRNQVNIQEILRFNCPTGNNCSHSSADQPPHPTFPQEGSISIIDRQKTGSLPSLSLRLSFKSTYNSSSLNLDDSQHVCIDSSYNHFKVNQSKVPFQSECNVVCAPTPHLLRSGFLAHFCTCSSH